MYIKRILRYLIFFFNLLFLQHFSSLLISGFKSFYANATAIMVKIYYFNFIFAKKIGMWFVCIIQYATKMNDEDILFPHMCCGLIFYFWISNIPTHKSLLPHHREILFSKNVLSFFLLVCVNFWCRWWSTPSLNFTQEQSCVKYVKIVFLSTRLTLFLFMMR